MRQMDGGRYDEFLMLAIGLAGIGLVILFASMAVLRPYYAMLMPVIITSGAFLSWALLRAARSTPVSEQAARTRQAIGAGVSHEAAGESSGS
ncbi:MAG: hypothetical protein V3U26_07005 [Dehalococcoidia bacterium]